MRAKKMATKTMMSVIINEHGEKYFVKFKSYLERIEFFKNYEYIQQKRRNQIILPESTEKNQSQKMNKEIDNNKKMKYFSIMIFAGLNQNNIKAKLKFNKNGFQITHIVADIEVSPTNQIFEEDCQLFWNQDIQNNNVLIKIQNNWKLVIFSKFEEKLSLLFDFKERKSKYLSQLRKDKLLKNFNLKLFPTLKTEKKIQKVNCFIDNCEITFNYLNKKNEKPLKIKIKGKILIECKDMENTFLLNLGRFLKNN